MDDDFMRTKPVFRLLLSMGVPMMISMFANSLYNIVDSIYIASLGTEALTALSLIYPMQNLIIAAGVGIGVGANAAIAKNLGAKDQEAPDRSAMNGFELALIAAFVCLLIGIFGVRPFIALFTADPVVTKYAVDYGAIVMIFSFGNILQVYMEKVYQSVGRMMITMCFLLTAAGLNAILDPILIFGLFGAPALGTAGAAIATVSAQIIVFTFYPIASHFRPIPVKFKRSDIGLDRKQCRQILKVALPSGLTVGLPSLLTSVLNGILIGFSNVYVAVLGIYFKIQTFFYLPASGLVQGMRPIVSYNYGAKEYERVRKTVRYAMLLIAGILAVGTLIVEFAPGAILSLFQADPDLLGAGSDAFRRIGLGFIPSAVGYVCCGAFEALGKGWDSLVVSGTRQFAAIVFFSWILAPYLGVNGIWFSFPLAEICTAVLAFWMLRRVFLKDGILSGAGPNNPI